MRQIRPGNTAEVVAVWRVVVIFILWPLNAITKIIVAVPSKELSEHVSFIVAFDERCHDRWEDVTV